MSRRGRINRTVAALILLAGCTPAHGHHTAPQAPLRPSQCHMRTAANGQDLPDPVCTPGVVNPAVTQANIRQTICVKGWTAKIRPPASVTGPEKKKIAARYGVTLHPGRRDELDHLISLELGGAPNDLKNFWIEPGKIPNPKDHVENALNQAVCDGRISLAAAQNAIRTDWTTAVGTLGLKEIN